LGGRRAWEPCEGSHLRMKIGVGASERRLETRGPSQTVTQPLLELTKLDGPASISRTMGSDYTAAALAILAGSGWRLPSAPWLDSWASAA